MNLSLAVVSTHPDAPIAFHSEVTVSTPFGAPSDNFMIGKIGKHEIVFLPRHGRGNHARAQLPP